MNARFSNDADVCLYRYIPSNAGNTGSRGLYLLTGNACSMHCSVHVHLVLVPSALALRTIRPRP